MSGRRALKILRLALTVGLLAFAVLRVGGAELRAAFRGAEPAALALVFVLANLDRLLMAWKWHGLLAARGLVLGVWDALGVYLVAGFWGSFLLPTVGADALRVHLVARRTGRALDVVASIVMERALGVLALGAVCVASLGLLAAGSAESALPLAAGGLGVGACVLAAFALSLDARRAEPLARRLRGRGRVRDALAGVLDAYQAHASHPRALARCFSWSVAEQLLQVGVACVMARALGLDAPVTALFVAVPIATVAGRLPLTIDGFGVREGVMVGLFALQGLPEGAGLVISVTSHVALRAATLPATGVVMLLGAWRPAAAHDHSQPAAR